MSLHDWRQTQDDYEAHWDTRAEDEQFVSDKLNEYEYFLHTDSDFAEEFYETVDPEDGNEIEAALLARAHSDLTEAKIPDGDEYEEPTQRFIELRRNRGLCVWCEKEQGKYVLGRWDTGRYVCGPHCPKRPSGKLRSDWNPASRQREDRESNERARKSNAPF